MTLNPRSVIEAHNQCYTTSLCRLLMSDAVNISKALALHSNLDCKFKKNVFF